MRATRRFAVTNLNASYTWSKIGWRRVPQRCGSNAVPFAVGSGSTSSGNSRGHLLASDSGGAASSSACSAGGRRRNWRWQIYPSHYQAGRARVADVIFFGIRGQSPTARGPPSSGSTSNRGDLHAAAATRPAKHYHVPFLFRRICWTGAEQPWNLLCESVGG